MLTAALLCGAPAAHGAGPRLSIELLSNRADLISGGDALIAVDIPRGVRRSRVRVRAGRRDVTRLFALRASGRFEGLVDGLRVGRTRMRAQVRGRSRVRGSTLMITNHPSGGPVFSGPQIQPWACDNGSKDPQCAAPATYALSYMSTDPTKGYRPYDPAARDIAMTTTDAGVKVPFVVRVETGYMDRDQYRIATLYQPGKPWQPWSPQPQFNHKLLITHGSSCNIAYGSGSAPDVLHDANSQVGTPLIDAYSANAPTLALSRGFAVMSTALDHNGHNCNIATQAESLVMAKEHVVETYGTLRYTIGTGCSGGSLVQQQVANAYPGIYQGILPQCSFPDTWTSATQVADYHLLRAYFEHPDRWGAGVLWDPLTIAAVEGNLLPIDAIVSDVGFFNAIVPTHACVGVGAAQRFDAQSNPGGVRCSIADYMVNVLGPRPRSSWSPLEQRLGHGFAGLPVGNTGAQYGLSLLQQGTITPAQFVDVNAKIGGVDINIEPTAQRIAADRGALRNAYRSGAINETTHLDKVAIINLAGPDPGAAHDLYRAFAIRRRLEREHGTAANQVIWEGQVPILGQADFPSVGLLAMDRWLSAVERDDSDRPLARRLIADRPADIHDQCTDGLGQVIPSQMVCDLINPYYGTPRTVAGQSLSTDDNACQLKTLSRADYPVTFTDEQWTRLVQTFPGGVCDWTKPGLERRPTIAWQTYQTFAGKLITGGRAMAPAPGRSGGGWTSKAFAGWQRPGE